MLTLKKRKESGLSAQALSTLSGAPRRTIEDVERRGDSRVSTAESDRKRKGERYKSSISKLKYDV